ncbi:hypothetical protein BC937DRAFT_93382, partial [Endogone sp. FLAS-F59071]
MTDMASPESITSQTNVNVLSNPAVSYVPLTLRVEYYLEDPHTGMMFVEPDPLVAPHRYPHMYTINQPLPGGARLWLPCIDDISERCTWEMEFIVPKQLLHGKTRKPESSIGSEDYDSMMVICSGELVEQTSHPTNPLKKIVHYILPVPTPAPYIAFAIGPFEAVKFSASVSETSQGLEAVGESKEKPLNEISMQPDIIGFCLPGRTEELRNSAEFLTKALQFYSQECESYPFTDYKVVFVEDAWCPAMSSASLAICSTHLLYPPDVIDQAYETRRTLSLALATQWLGIHIVPKVWPDIWLIVGMANFVTSMFLKKHLGNNEYRLRLKKDIARCCAMDVGRPPLYNHALPSPIDLDDLEFIELKAPLVLWMLDKRMCKGGGSLGLSRVIPKIMVAAMSGELIQNALSTHWFIKSCRKISGVELKSFADQWIYHSGCPKFKFRYVFNRKKMVVEITMTQENTNTIGGKEGSVVNGIPIDAGPSLSNEMVTPLFTGNLTARIHEADGTPYEHILDIQENSKKFEVQFNTKYKRIRRNTKRFQAKQAAAAAVAAEEDILDGDEGEVAALGVIPVLGLGMPMFENETEREEWRVIEWGQGEDDISGAASATFDWIRLDAEFEWVCALDFIQPDYMWAAQLTKDRDTVAQYEAIEALKAQPSVTASTSLLRALMDQKCFYRIRMEAAYALAKCATPELDWVGLLQLTKAFQKRFCYPSSTFADQVSEGEIPVLPCIPKPNNFSSLTEYFIQKSIPVAVSQVRDERGHAPLKIKQFLLDLLMYNDNTGNMYSDNYYVSTLISALGHSLIPDPNVVKESGDGMEIDDFDSAEILEEARREIERYRTLDYLIPTYHNTVTVACLETFTILMSAGLMQPDLRLYLTHSRYGNFLTVRMAAFDSLFVLNGLLNSDLVKYFFATIRHDRCPFLSFYVTRSLMKLLSLMMGNRRDRAQKDYLDDLVEEEDKGFVQGSLHSRISNSVSFGDVVEAVRKELEGNLELQSCLWDTLNSHTFLDHRIRKYLLLFCEIVYKPIDFGLPKLKIRMPVPTGDPTVEDESEVDIIKPVAAKLPPAKTLTKSKTMSLPNEMNDSEMAQKSGKSTHMKNMQGGIAKTTKKNGPHNKTKDVSMDSSSSATVPGKQNFPHTLLPSKPLKFSDNMKVCRRILKKLMSHENAWPFLQSVDEAQAPGYYTIIKEPIDLSIIKTKLEQGEYTSIEGFHTDVKRMFTNCYSYNPIGTPVHVEGSSLESWFDVEWKKEFGDGEEDVNMTIREIASEDSPIVIQPRVKPAPTLSGSKEHRPSESSSSKSAFVSHIDTKIRQAVDLQKCQKVLKKLMDDPASYEFRKPVDPVRQGIPHYIEIIKHPMDLGTIDTKLRTGKYTSFEEFDHDVHLVFNNCLRFNLAGSFVYEQGKKMLEIYDQAWNEQTAGGYTIVERKEHSVTKKEASLKQKITEISKPAQHTRSVPPFDEAKDRTQAKTPKTVVELPTSVGSKNASATILVGDDSQSTLLYESNRLPSTAVKAITRERSDIGNERTAHMSTDRSISSAMKDGSGASDIRREKSSVRSKDNATSLIPPSLKLTQPIPDPPHILGNALEDRMSDVNKEKCGKIVQKLVSHQSSQPFQKPVDVVALKIPDYSEIVKRPMDLSTVRKNLDSGLYTTIKAFEIDCRQIFWNCFKFNSPISWVAEQGKAMESLFNQIWSVEFGKKDAIRADDKRKAQKILQKLRSNEAASIFVEPVDLDEFPTYPTIIKKPIDLRTISEKLESGQYSSFQEFVDDIDLMFSNCYTFNPATTFGNEAGKRLELVFRSAIKELKGTTKKEPLSIPPSVKPTKSVTATVPSITRSAPLKTVTIPKAPTLTLLASTEKVNKTLQSISDPRKLDKLLKKLMIHRAAAPFNKPVDPITENVPHYTQIITKPMDFSTIEQKLKAGKYRNMANFSADVKLVFENCYKFNTPEHTLSEQAKLLENIFDKEVEKEVSLAENEITEQSSKKSQDFLMTSSNQTKAQSLSDRTAPTLPIDNGAELKKYEQVLRKLRSHAAYHIFKDPVDAMALGIPQYYDIVKKPMDFGTIEKRLKTGAYGRIDDLILDAAQVFYNCYLFNPPDDMVYESGEALEKEWDVLCTQRGLKSGVPVTKPTTHNAPIVTGPLTPTVSQVGFVMRETDAAAVLDDIPKSSKKRKKDKKDKDKKKHKKHKHRHMHDYDRLHHSTASQQEGISSRSMSPVAIEYQSDDDGIIETLSEDDQYDSEDNNIHSISKSVK